MRAAALLGALGLLFIAAGCSGNRGGATPPVPFADQANQPVPGSTLGTMSSTTTSEDSTISSALKMIKIQGPIVALKTGGFQINGGSGAGYENIYPTSSTKLFYGGLKPTVGYYATVTISGTLSTFTPMLIALSTSQPSSVSVTGTVESEQTYGVAIKLDSNGTYIPLAFNTNTNLYGFIGTGVHVSASGTGSAATAVFPSSVTNTSSTSSTASPSPTSSPASAPAHVMTAAVVWAYGGVPTSVSISSVKPYVTWVQTDPTYASTMRSNGLKVDIYENFWRNYSSDNPAVGYTDLEPGGAHAPAEAKTCTGTVIYDSTYGGGYESDARSSYAAGHAAVFNNYRISEYGSNYNAIFSDDTGAMGGLPLPCNWSLSAYESATNAVHASLKVPIFVNTLGAESNPENQVGYVTGASNVIGGMCEICLAGDHSGTDYVQTGTYWQEVENAAISLVANHKIFWDYARATGNPSSETGLRTYIYASFLLSYAPSYSMLQEAFESSYGFPVMPETGFVALDPVTSASSVSGYLTSTGAYMRQFGACYYRGSYKGKCAVVVNPGGVTVSVPTTAYTHSLGLVGGGVLDGGYATFGDARPSSLGPSQAAILLP